MITNDRHDEELRLQNDLDASLWHRLANVKNSRSDIHSMNVDCARMTDQIIISDHIINFYSRLFVDNNISVFDQNIIDNIIPHSVMAEENAALTRQLEDLEIQNTSFDIDGES